jgi:hypothetical protein
VKVEFVEIDEVHVGRQSGERGISLTSALSTSATSGRTPHEGAQCCVLLTAAATKRIRLSAFTSGTRT